MDFRRKSVTLVALALAALAIGAVTSRAETRVSRAVRRVRPMSVEAVSSLDNQRRVDVNSINMFVTNFGSWAYDLGTGNAGLIYPKGTNKTAIFASGPWFGATVNGEVRTEVGEYSQEYNPGVILREGPWSVSADPADLGMLKVWDDPDRPEYMVYKMARWTGDPLDSTHLERTVPANDPNSTDPLVHHSWNEYMTGAVPRGAPWKMYRLPNPASPGDSLDVPGPDVAGDQMLWSVYNDAAFSRHTNEAGKSLPLGLEIRQTTFAFDRQGALGNAIFVKLEIIHPELPAPADTVYRTTLENMYVSLWADPDLGGATDDLVGCDTLLSLGYCYNATNNDQLYGTTPPAVGYDFFLGPKPFHGATTTLPMTSFNKYINGTDPASSEATYNYMQGLQADGTDLINPITGLPTRFFDSGDPVKGTGWIDGNAADKRMMLSSGPFSMSPGDTQVVVGAIVIARGSDRLASVTGLKFYDTFAQAAFDSNFNLPPPPPQPKVTTKVAHQEIQFCWDTGSWSNYVAPPGYKFEGYVVYQGTSKTGPWKRLVTYDLVDSIGVVRDTVFDTTTGQLITDYPVAFGGDNGLAYCYSTTQDAIGGGTLRDATPYYFAVTAYAVPADKGCLDGTALPGALCPEPRVLETSQQPITVIPQRPALGTDPATAAAVMTHLRIDTSKPPGTDDVQFNVVAPELVTGHIYKVFYTPTERPPVTIAVGPDTATVLFAWNVQDSTTGAMLLTNQLNRRGDLDYQVVDGIQMMDIGKYFPALQSVAYFDNKGASSTALEGVNFGLGLFGGGADYAFNFFGSTLDPIAMPDSFTSVEVRFSHSATQKAYRFLRREMLDGSAPAVGRGYIYGGFHPCNFQVWDVTNNVQLDAAFLEKVATASDGTILPPAQQPATFDSTWRTTADDVGDREYLFVYRRPYSDAPKAELAVDASVYDGNVPVLYTVGPKLHDATSVVEDGSTLQLLYANPSTSNDVYVFNTSKLVRGDAGLAKAGLDRIRVVPNPYYNRSGYELSQFNRVMRFINMPEVATVRIFSLSGQLVRTLQKTDPTTSLLDWDLHTENRLPVASGVYVYHVEAPGVGTIYGRLVVFMEKERLNTF